jgi:hypothetical protein
MPMKTSIPGFLLTLVRARGSADRAVDMVSRRLAERVPEEIIRTLRDEADSWVRPPGVGALGPMADSCIHLRDAARPRPAGTARRLTTALGLPNVATRASEGADSRRQR